MPTIVEIGRSDTDETTVGTRFITYIIFTILLIMIIAASTGIVLILLPDYKDMFTSIFTGTVFTLILLSFFILLVLLWTNQEKVQRLFQQNVLAESTLTTECRLQVVNK